MIPSWQASSIDLSARYPFFPLMLFSREFLSNDLAFSFFIFAEDISGVEKKAEIKIDRPLKAMIKS